MKTKFKATKKAVLFKMFFYLTHENWHQKKTNLSFLTCTAESQMVSGRGAEFDTAHIGLCLDACHWVVQVGRPQLH